jgi:NAD(P)-dependent dehydrogenase (short-subunit alcohol dehydrogenase family)
MKISGSVALVTGANRGIGRALVTGLLGAGAKVYAAARDPSRIDVSGAVPVRLDVTDGAQVSACAAACPDVTLLINNAGMATFSPLIAAPTMEGARQEMEVNYFGTLAMCRAFAPILAKNAGGAIVNMLSVASWSTGGQLGSYSASKMAALGLTRGVRIELRAQGTLVVSVHPSWVATDMIAHMTAGKVEPDEVAAATLAAVEAGEEEVATDERSRRIRALLRTDPEKLQADAQRAWDQRLIPAGG